ncbi:hypothetical protein M407DRAFT_189006, partial [Tulasnella calospora MUT 4182]
MLTPQARILRLLVARRTSPTLAASWKVRGNGSRATNPTNKQSALCCYRQPPISSAFNTSNLSAMATLPTVLLDVNYTDEKTKIEHFLRNFVSQDVTRAFGEMDLEDHEDDEGMGGEDRGTYMKQLQQIANRRQQALEIDLEDVSKHDKGITGLVAAIRGNTRRYTQLFCEVVDSIIPQPTVDISMEEDPLDVILHQRREQQAQSQAENPEAAPFPPELMRRYNLYFKPLASDNIKPFAVREVHGSDMGKLIT